MRRHSMPAAIPPNFRLLSVIRLQGGYIIHSFVSDPIRGDVKKKMLSVASERT